MSNPKIFKLLLISLVGVVFSGLQVSAQSDNIILGSKEYTMLNRLEILLQNDSILNFNTVKPLDRQSVTRQIAYIDSMNKAGKLSVQLSAIDRNDISNFLMKLASITPSSINFSV